MFMLNDAAMIVQNQTQFKNKVTRRISSMKKLIQELKGGIEGLHKKLVFIAITIFGFGQASLVISLKEE